jgi:hypothetical protein
MENYLAEKSIAIWSADEVADDWFHGISAAQIAARAIRRIEAHNHRGVLLLHDIHPATALALPTILKELKERGYHIVQVVAPGDRPASVPELAAPIAQSDVHPHLIKASVSVRRHHARHASHRYDKRRLGVANEAKAAKASYGRGFRFWTNADDHPWRPEHQVHSRSNLGG